MSNISFRQKYLSGLLSAFLFPLIVILFFSIPLSPLTIPFFFLFLFVIILVTYFMLKPLQVFLETGDIEDIDKINYLTYKIPVINTLMVTFMVICVIIFQLFSEKQIIFSDRFLNPLRLFPVFISTVIYTYFVTGNIMYQARVRVFARRKTVPLSKNRNEVPFWKGSIFFFITLAIVPLFSVFLSSIIRSNNSINVIQQDISISLFSVIIIFIPIFILYIMNMTTPVKFLISGMDKFKEEDFESVIPVISNNEIGMVAGELNQLSARLFSYRSLLRERIDRLTLLYNISQAANHIDNLDKLLSFMLDSVINSLKSEKASIMLLNEETGILYNKAFKGSYDNGRDIFIFKKGEGIAGKVIETGRAIVANTGYKHSEFLIRDGNNSDRLIKNMLCVPMVIKDKVIGVVNLCNRKEDTDYSDDDLDLLTTLSAKIAGVIENFRLRQIELDNVKKEKFAYMGRVAAGVAHEIKNPLNAIGMIIQRFKREFKPMEDEEEYINLIEIVTEEVYRVNNIVERFLKFAREKKLELSNINFTELIEETITILKPQADEKGIIIEKYLKENLFWELDRTQIKQVIMNILLNAIEATQSGGKIKVSLEHEANKIYLKIKDSGSGIPEELQGKIFELYFTTKSTGNGLGLCIAQKIVEQHKGKMEFTSLAGDGTEFVIWLPVSLE